MNLVNFCTGSWAGLWLYSRIWLYFFEFNVGCVTRTRMMFCKTEMFHHRIRPERSVAKLLVVVCEARHCHPPYASCRHCEERALCFCYNILCRWQMELANFLGFLSPLYWGQGNEKWLFHSPSENAEWSNLCAIKHEYSI